MHMIINPNVRLFQPADLPQIRDLEAQVQPYRPEDQPEVEAMYRRARFVEHNDERWAPIPPGGPSIERIQQDFLAFWVAGPESRPEQILGMVGAGRLDFAMLPPNSPYTRALQGRSDFLELQHLRVSPNARGMGLGASLCQAVIEWSRSRGYSMLLVNTTTPQTPARRLYQKLGFQEAAQTYVGVYELVWMEKRL